MPFLIHKGEYIMPGNFRPDNLLELLPRTALNYFPFLVRPQPRIWRSREVMRGKHKKPYELLCRYREGHELRNSFFGQAQISYVRQRVYHTNFNSTGHLTKIRKPGPGWISYLIIGALYNSFSITTPPFSYFRVNLSLAFLFLVFL